MFALGGAGEAGRGTARKLVKSDVVTEIVVAARNLEAARCVAAELGDKASVVQIDIRDEKRLVSQMADSDIILNTIGPDCKSTLPILHAAIKSGVNYCDLCCHGLTRQKALELDGAAKASNITALMGIAICGLSNLMMMHAAHRLDRAEELRCNIFSPVIQWGDPQTMLEEWRKSGSPIASWQSGMRMAADKTPIYRNGRWINVDPLKEAVHLKIPLGGETTAYPLGYAEPITIPRALPNIQSVSTNWSLFPQYVNEKLFEIGHRLAKGEFDEPGALIAFYEYLAAQPKGSLDVPKEYEGAYGFLLWIEAIGMKNSQRTRYSCWPAGVWESWASSTGTTATAVLKVLRGDVRSKGVISPESCFDPMPFFAEMAKNASVEVPNGRFLDESFETLGNQ